MNSERQNPTRRSLPAKIRWGVRYGKFQDQRGRAVRRAVAAGVEDEVVHWMVDSEVRPLEITEASGHLIPFEASQHAFGDYLLGHDPYGREVRASRSSLPKNALLVGSVGSGKSTLLRNLARQAAVDQTNIMLFEGAKKSLRRLRKALRKERVNLIILRAPRCKLNPLQADVEDPRVHKAVIQRALAQRLGVGPRGAILIGQALHDLYKRHGIWEGHRDSWPCIFCLCEYIRDTPGQNAAARDAVLERLISVCESITPACGAYHLAWRPSDLAKRNLVIESAGKSEMARNLDQEYVLSSIFHHEVHHGNPTGELQLLVAFDDAQSLFESGNDNAAGGGAQPLPERLRDMRECGIGVVAVVHGILGLHAAVLGNTGLKAMAVLGHPADYDALGAAMGMSREQIEWAKLHLRPGLMVIQMSEGTDRKPILCQMEDLRLTEPVSDEEADESAKALDDLPTVPATQYARWEPYPRLEVASHRPPLLPSTAPTVSLTEREVEFARLVVAQPNLKSSDYARLSGVSGKRFMVMRDRLVSLGFIRLHTVATTGRGRPATVIEPLDPAKNLPPTTQEEST